MPNRLYQAWKQARGTGASVTNLNGATNLRLVLSTTTTYTPNTAIGGHSFLSDIPAGSRLTTTAALTAVTWVDATLKAADAALPDPGGGAVGNLLVLYEDTGTATTSRLILLIDTATGLPITLDGTNDTIQFAAAGIFAL